MVLDKFLSTRVTWEDSLSMGQLSPAGACLWGILLVANWGRNVQPTMCVAVHSQVGWDCTGETAEQARGTKPGSSIPPWFLLPAPALGSCTGFLQWCNVTCKPNKPFCPQVIFGQCFITATGKQNRTVAFSPEADEWPIRMAKPSRDGTNVLPPFRSHSVS